MNNFFSKFFNLKNDQRGKAPRASVQNMASPDDGSTVVKDELDRKIDMLLSLLVEYYGSDKLVIKAGKMEALQLIRSPIKGERVLALQKIMYDNPTLTAVPEEKEIPQLLDQLIEKMSDLLARRSLEADLEQKIADRLEENHQDYVQDIRRQILKEEKKGYETPMEQQKREKLEELEKVKLTQSVMELLRPDCLEDIVGQERAVASLLAKLSSPYPQHLILYGPPGVGKTTAARLVLEASKERPLSPFRQDAPFVETDGTTLRWDPRDLTNPLLGSVHDPIYQGARRDLADTGIPEPKPGLVTDAHGGILFIDEIGEMDVMLQNKLLKVLEDKRAFFESAYYDPTDDKVPPYIRKLFEEGAPADFVLIGATTRDSSSINPALRSRCAEIYFEPLTPQHIEEIVQRAARRLSATLGEGVARLISEYTIEGRKAINILADAYSLALERSQQPTKAESDDEAEAGAADSDKAAESTDTASGVVIERADIYKVAQVSRLSPYVTKKASDRCEVGHIFGLGVAGFLGSVIEIEAVAFEAHEKGKGTVRFNETAGSMAKDSVFNAASVVRMVTGKDIHDYDLHINVVGGGNIDGPSAGTAILTAIISAITGQPIRQDTAVTGEISLQGRVRPVGGVFEKAYGAKQAGISRLIIPSENTKDIPKHHLGLEIFPVSTAQEALDLLLAKEE
ncbi:Lon family ATP-dependent protease [Anaerovibrio slackiae]|uniref:Lon family ATP-dependent protease n=1 Tax=Anaerovibrio slackiae TaxID=2652309 RepID=UPI003868FEAF